MSFNKVILLGHLGQDPESRFTKSGTQVVNFSLATNERWGGQNGGEVQERTEWHKIVVFGKQAETCARYLSKGRQVLIEGRLQTRSWEDQSGQKRFMTEIVANNVRFVGGAGGGERSSPPPRQEARPANVDTVPEFNDDDVPF